MTVGRARRENSRFRPQADILAKRIRALRTTQGLTQEDVARRAGIGIATLRKIESGAVVEPGYFTVLAIAAALHTGPTELHAAVTPTGPLPTGGISG
ncbi:helix-turn-helix domain-containing protein [Actinoplanes derwentensis]|uniref:Helix-turn-helix domain-containing protein n=1 Tax=Actinoplanes derwentensis TaxID=113562 RepID=A0A1H2DBY0_9ACTN|nr:Helix-turn-helix domain-containing protein [Actinoplanes derwentensis]